MAETDQIPGVSTSDFEVARAWRFDEEEQLDAPIPYVLRTPVDIHDEETAQ